MPSRVAYLVLGALLKAVATAADIRARLGPGPRDGLMTGIELAVLSARWLLGGTVGVGTLIYAFAIGRLVHLLLPPLEMGKREAPATVSPGPQWS